MDTTVTHLELDAEGYPTEGAERIVREFEGSPSALLALVKTGWHLGSWQEEDVEYGRRYEISTFGWSGNESLIAAMTSNRRFWNTTLVQSRGHGRYTFEVPGYRAVQDKT